MNPFLARDPLDISPLPPFEHSPSRSHFPAHHKGRLINAFAFHRNDLDREVAYFSPNARDIVKASFCSPFPQSKVLLGKLDNLPLELIQDIMLNHLDIPSLFQLYHVKSSTPFTNGRLSPSMLSTRFAQFSAIHNLAFKPLSPTSTISFAPATVLCVAKIDEILVLPLERVEKNFNLSEKALESLPTFKAPMTTGLMDPHDFRLLPADIWNAYTHEDLLEHLAWCRHAQLIWNTYHLHSGRVAA
ncbi:hypothetical protein K504DRAFT_501672 [Pleomassaria siparia CBS 279.74]|uniref:F-box domain-containing protein n=1 Tax=Pleomassaria siparia CBS 279.74 TaxID=1314801 RepID=A0A6G1KC15_9PLEO|nr:hypothetical protein K504DRAFT_501672 [Pleomassaria siparia CBS 279.74]